MMDSFCAGAGQMRINQTVHRFDSQGAAIDDTSCDAVTADDAWRHQCAEEQEVCILAHCLEDELRSKHHAEPYFVTHDRVLRSAQPAQKQGVNHGNQDMDTKLPIGPSD